MTLKKYYENPKVTDQIEFDLFMPDADNCFNEHPFKIDNIKIYFVARDLSGLKNEASLVDGFSVEQQKEYLEAQQAACENPTLNNLAKAQRLKDAFDASSVVNISYYSEAKIVFNQGSSSDPLWLRDGSNIDSILTPIVDPDSNIQYGYFQFIWTPEMIREGDFYICYTYTPNMSGDSISTYLHFYVQSNIANEVANPAHITKPEKYEILLDTYLPEMYKQNYALNDLSVFTISNFHKAVARGFTELENLANQLIDIIDANATQEPLLGYLANFFALKLRSTDVTLWRKQIKKAIPVYKMKGTLKGLEEALMDAGIRLLKYTQYWQTGTIYTYTETFKFTGDYNFELSRVSLAVNTQYFELYLRTPTLHDGNYWPQNVNTDIDISTANGISTMTWTGNPLAIGDVIKITYQIKAFENVNQQFIHDYIKTLPLADTRDDKDVEYPPKDWNTKLIAEDDVLFDLVVSSRNPFVPDLNFGKIRTQFPYSENVYNMEEYNGSLRDSKSPCDIDKEFIDPCRSSISAYYMLDVDINDLSNTRLTECQEIIADYTPFHATLHTLNFSGAYQDFVLPPEETIEALVKYTGEETCIAGMAQVVFNRAMQLGLQANEVLRNSLASQTLVTSGNSTAYNDYINLYCSNVNFENLGLSSTAASTFLEVLSPAYYQGEYTVSNPFENYVRLEDTITEPLNTSDFSFRLSNIMFASNGFAIVQNNRYDLSDPTIDLYFYDIKSIWDVDQGYATSPWQVRIVSTGFSYEIKSFVNNIITLENDGTLSNTSVSGIEYVLVNSSAVDVMTSTAGEYVVTKFGKVTVPVSLGIEDVRNVLRPTTYLYLDSDSSQYAFYSFVENETQDFIISGWDSGSAPSESCKLLQRLVAEDVGNFSYEGMKIVKPGGWPTFADPDNPLDAFINNQTFKENYILVIDSSNYYFIDMAVDGDNCLHIGGKFLDLGTTSSAGTSVAYSLYQFSKETVEMFGEQLVDLSRNGQEIINSVTEISTPMMPFMSMAEQEPDSGVVDFVKNIESISYKIEHANGTTETGVI